MIKIREKELVEAYIHYIYDIEKWETRFFPISEIKPTINMKRYREVYTLDKVAYYLDGKPVFMLIRGVPYSVELDRMQEEAVEKLKIKGYTASEIEAKINSIYVNAVFRKGSLQFKDYLVLLLTNIITGLAVYIVSSLWDTASVAGGV